MLNLCAQMAHHYHSIGLSKITFVLFHYNQIIGTIDTTSTLSSRQRGREGKGMVFYTDPNRIIWVQPAPWSRCCILG